MPIIELNDQEMGNLMFILANAEFRNGVTWAMLNPVLMTIGRQAEQQKQTKPTDYLKEVDHGQRQ